MWYVWTGEDMEYLEKMLSITPLTIMDLGGIKTGDRTKERNANSKSSIAYQWAGEEIGAKEALKLSESLETNTTLTKLNLSGDEIKNNET